MEKSAEGLNVFSTRRPICRDPDLLLSRSVPKPPLNITNEDRDRIGTGLAYRVDLNIPPMTEKAITYNLKPAWWAMVRTRELLSRLETVDQIAVEDVTPQRTQAILFKRTADGKAVVIVWRNDDPGAASFAHTGLALESAEDIFGAAVPAKDGWYGIGKVPVVFTLNAPASSARDGLDAKYGSAGWRSRSCDASVHCAIHGPIRAQSFAYEQIGGDPTPT